MPASCWARSPSPCCSGSSPRRRSPPSSWAAGRCSPRPSLSVTSGSASKPDEVGGGVQVAQGTGPRAGVHGDGAVVVDSEDVTGPHLHLVSGTHRRCAILHVPPDSEEGATPPRLLLTVIFLFERLPHLGSRCLMEGHQDESVRHQPPLQADRRVQ